jgi:hypothetical protein
MIINCPYCGKEIPEKLVDGLAACSKCNRVFDGSLINRLLSASWLVRQNTYHGTEQLISDTKLPEHEAILVYAFADYSHDELLKVLGLLGIGR